MFICENCLKNRDMDNEFMVLFMSPRSYGPCELCGNNGVCSDYHGNIKPEKELSNPQDSHNKTE